MKCPLCNSIDTGKVGSNQYYCWNCLVEFCMTGTHSYTAWHVDEEGSLVALNAAGEPEGPAVESRTAT